MGGRKGEGEVVCFDYLELVSCTIISILIIIF